MPPGAKTRPIEYVVDDRGCHICTSHRGAGSGRYPTITVKGKSYRISRYLYAQRHGPLTDDQVVRHRCDNPRCINVEHFEPGTPQDNVADRVARGRSARGERAGGSKLTESQVIEILHSPESARSLARRLGVNKEAVAGVRRGRTWKHVPRPACWEGGKAPPRPPHRGTQLQGAKLTEDDVRAIRASAKSFRSLAREYGVSSGRISDIKKGKSWAHVTDEPSRAANRDDNGQ